MRKTNQVPGVYMQESTDFESVVTPVPTAVPIFIGYTDRTLYHGESLVQKAIKVSSLAEFLMIFGATPPKVQFKIVATSDEDNANADFTFDNRSYHITKTTVNYRLHSSIRLFYENGGEHCYVISVGACDYSKTALTETSNFISALKLLEKESEPTMLVIPDVVELMDPTYTDKTDPEYFQKKYAHAYALQNEMINHCSTVMSRVAILDVPGGYYQHMLNTSLCIAAFRNNIKPSSSMALSYAAAYFPWLHTTVYQASEISANTIAPETYAQVVTLLETEFKDPHTGEVENHMRNLIRVFTNPSATELEKADTLLKKVSMSYSSLMDAILGRMNLLAPSAAIAGIFTVIDNAKGVWSAPANIALNATVAPSIEVDQELQQFLNLAIDGKSICAIRAFPKLGNLIWGARTLDGNSQDWRYINIRRLVIYIEQSIKVAVKPYAFASNDASTWDNIKRMIGNFLTELWKQGGLSGAVPADAFSIAIGLGSTMTAEDISDGVMKITVKLAVSRPAEFIVITLQQKIQKE